MIPYIAYPCISGSKYGSVRKPGHDPCPVSEAPVFCVIVPGLTVCGVLYQSASVGAYPQMIIAIHIHAPDALILKSSSHVISYLAFALLIHDIQSFICTDIIGVLPEDYGIYDPPFHSYGTVNILEGGFRKTQQSQSRGCEPEIPLIITKYVIDRVIEIVCIEPVIAVLVNIGNTAVRGYEKSAVA